MNVEGPRFSFEFMCKMAKQFVTSDDQLRAGCADFWQTYYLSMRELHERQGRPIHAPIKDRNLGTTDSQHIVVFEHFWKAQLAAALKVDPAQVGPRRIRFRPHRTKSFDVCWPLEGEPKILISIKSMQNAYRNFTNRIEEAFGDSAVLRLYRVPAVFGFFFFMLDGKVPRGLAEQGKTGLGHIKSGKGKGVAPHLDLIEEGGDFFELSHLEEHRKAAVKKARKTLGRQNVINLAEQSLIDLVAEEPTAEGGIHYDAIAFAPTTIKRLKPDPETKNDWGFDFTPVDERLDFHPFISRLIDVARFRHFI
jgi:hypothetical protein